MFAQALNTATYDTVEWWYRNGFISYDEWTAYRCKWRNSVPRFSELAREHDACKGGECKFK